MKAKTLSIIDEILLKNDLSYLADAVKKAVSDSVERILSGGKIVVCGNGGSAADSDHIVGELLKSFILPRNLSEKDKEKFLRFGEKGKFLAENLQYGIPAVSLSNAGAISTAIVNDSGAELVFAQQAFGVLSENDVLIGISTSGNAKNVALAMTVAKIKGAHCICLSGRDGGELKKLADVNLIVNLDETYKIQEKHQPIYHLYCMCLENELFGD